MKCTLIVITTIILSCQTSGSKVSNIDDSIIFSFVWKPSKQDEPTDRDQFDAYRIKSARNEIFDCYIPRNLRVKGKLEEIASYSGPTPYELLEPLFAPNNCRYKLDYYWTYQLCHGKSLRQYHEDIMASRVSIVQFYLGKYDHDSLSRDNQLYKEKLAETPEEFLNVPTMKINGVDHPYLALNMSYGTLCDINEKPRSTIVYYVCQEDGDNEIFSLEEATTCTYKVVVRTPYLCRHPSFKVDLVPENEVACHLQNGAESENSAAPSEFSNSESKFYEPKDLQTITEGNKEFRDFHLKQEPETASNQAGRMQDVLKAVERSLRIVFLPENGEEPNQSARDDTLVKKFLKGDFCLTGGTGWWKYEFCHGKHVTQFHMEKGEKVKEILLGRWNEPNHRNWVKKHESRKVPVNPEYVRHFYSEGDFCEVSQKKRTVEVKLSCKIITSHPDSVSIFLQEPKPCEYRLTVESAILCDLLKNVDEDGLPELISPVPLNT